MVSHLMRFNVDWPRTSDRRAGGGPLLQSPTLVCMYICVTLPLVITTSALRVALLVPPVGFDPEMTMTSI